MKNNLFILVILILFSVASYYYGVNRGAKVTTDTLTLQLGMNAIDQMVMNSALLLSLKNEKQGVALDIAQQLVEHDMKHLDRIELMLEGVSIDEFDKNVFKLSILEARENHKLVNDL